MFRNLAHKVCKILNIKSKAKHYKYKRPGEESIKYKNIIQGNWNTTRPFEKLFLIQLLFQEENMIGHFIWMYLIMK